MVARTRPGPSPTKSVSRREAGLVTNTGPDSDPGHTLSVIDLKTRKEVHRVELGPLPNPHGLVRHGGKFYFTAEGARLMR